MGGQKELDSKVLEQSWDAVVADLRKSFGIEEETKKLSKSEKEGDQKESQVDDQTDDTSESESKEEFSEEMEKSLSEKIGANDTEAEIAMDIEPFLKSFAEEVGKELRAVYKVAAKVKTLEKSVNSLTKMVKALGAASIATAEMQKSMSEGLEKFGSVNIPSMARLRKGGDRFQVEEGNEMTMSEIMLKATDLCRQGKLSTTDVTILEGRLQKGMEIPEGLKPLFKKA